MGYECNVSFGIKPTLKRHIEMVHEGKSHLRALSARVGL